MSGKVTNALYCKNSAYRVRDQTKHFPKGLFSKDILEKKCHVPDIDIAFIFFPDYLDRTLLGGHCFTSVFRGIHPGLAHAGAKPGTEWL